MFYQNIQPITKLLVHIQDVSSYFPLLGDGIRVLFNNKQELLNSQTQNCQNIFKILSYTLFMKTAICAQ